MEKSRTEAEAPLVEAQLPRAPRIPTVTLTREKLEWYRREYGRLLDFAAIMCDTPKTKVCRLDLLAAEAKKLGVPVRGLLGLEAMLDEANG